jgi:hypothetical protein
MCLALSVSWLVKPDSLVMSMLLFVESMLWSIIGESGFVVSSIVPSAQALLSLHMPTGKLGSRPLRRIPHKMLETPASHKEEPAAWILNVSKPGLHYQNSG